jgi:putative DNA primase/helicase
MSNLEVQHNNAKPALVCTPPCVDFPRICTNEQPRTIIERSNRLLLDANVPPSLFSNNGRLVRVVEGLDRSRIEQVTAKSLYKKLVGLADWIKQSGIGSKPSSPPSAVVQAIIEEPDKGFPELVGVSNVPVFGSGWELVNEPGYNEITRMYLGHNCPLLGSSVFLDDMIAARGILLEAVRDFPFADASSKAHALASILLPFVRGALGDAPTPLHVIEAPTPGSGKGRLADLVSVIATGSCCRPTSLSASTAENAKKLSSILVTGAPIILLDNLPQEKVLNDSVLASMLTTTSPTERLLGRSSMMSLTNLAVWIATANNPRCSLELTRRSVRIRLDPSCDRPWLRKDFLHPDLLGWARTRRADLVAACLCLVRAWVENGRPGWTDGGLGSFEVWSSTIGGILAGAGIPGFLGNLEEAYRENDGESEDWLMVVQLWWQQFGNNSVRASDICELCVAHGLLDDVIGFGAARSQVSRLGRALQQNTGRVFGGLKLVRDRSAVQSSARYMLQEVGSG